MARTTRGWAVFTPRGRLMWETGSSKREDAIYAARCEWGLGLSWETLEAEGYTCRRVTVTAEV